MKRWRYVAQQDDNRWPWNPGAGFDTLAELRQYALDLESEGEGGEDVTSWDGGWMLVDLALNDGEGRELLWVRYEGGHGGGQFKWRADHHDHLNMASWQAFEQGARPWLVHIDALIAAG